MRGLLLLMLVAAVAAAAEWDVLQQLQAGQKIEITTRDGTRTKAAFVSATADTLVVRRGSSEQSITRPDVLRVRVADTKRQVRNGIIWTAIGAGAGVAVGVAVCPHCGNEGQGAKYVVPALAVGAGIGALKFFFVPYRTIYQSN